MVTISGNTLNSQHRPPDLQIQAESRIAEAFARAEKVNPNLASRLDLLSDDRVSAGTDVVKGLASTVWNLQGIVKIIDPLAEVSAHSCLSPLYVELIESNTCWQIHPFVNAAWKLISFAYQVVQAQAILDKSITALIDIMAHNTKLAKHYAPLKGRHMDSDSIVQDILREVLSGASAVFAYCEKRDSGEYFWD